MEDCAGEREEDRGSPGDRGEGGEGERSARMESLEYEMNLINAPLMK